MAKIDEHTEQRIKAAANIVDVIEDCGISLVKRGAHLECLCPFHEDRHVGSFVVHERMNFYKCFSCGESGDAVKFLMKYQNIDYPTALRYLAAMYNIYIDDQPAPVVAKREPRKPMPPTNFVYWDSQIIKSNVKASETNNLVKWMLSLPLKPEHKRNLRNAIQLYLLGTSLNGYTLGWTMYPQIDSDMRLRDIKFMAYQEDGHRVKDQNGRGRVTWMRAIMEKAGRFDSNTQHVEHCLFGLHLAKLFPTAEICLVESEKSAVLCSTFTDPNERLWLATGGKSQFRAEMLRPLINDKRYIVAYPDIDGYEEWESMVKVIDYPRMSISNKTRELHILSDGPKADIADIMVRLMHGVTESLAEKICRRTHTPEKLPVWQKLIDNFNLQEV